MNKPMKLTELAQPCHIHNETGERLLTMAEVRSITKAHQINIFNSVVSGHLKLWGKHSGQVYFRLADVESCYRIKIA